MQTGIIPAAAVTPRGGDGRSAKADSGLYAIALEFTSARVTYSTIPKYNPFVVE